VPKSLVTILTGAATLAGVEEINPLFIAQAYDWSNNAAFYPLLPHRQKQDSYDSDVDIAPIGYRIRNTFISINVLSRSLWELSSIKINPPQRT